MLRKTTRVARLVAPGAWVSLIAAALCGWLPVGGVVAAAGLLLTLGTRDAIAATHDHDIMVMGRALAEVTRDLVSPEEP